MLDYVFGGRAAPEAYAAFAYDERFLRTLAPALLVMLGANILLLATLVVRGRWQPLTRRIDIGLTVVTCALLTWILFSGNMFQATPTESSGATRHSRHRPGRAVQLGTQDAQPSAARRSGGPANDHARASGSRRATLGSRHG